MEMIIHNLQDMTYLSWSLIRGSSGTAGSFLKSYEETSEGKIYYKLSNYDSYRGVIGHECVNEIIADRLLTILGIPHLAYQLIHANILVDGQKQETWLCASKDYKQRGDRKTALDVYYQIERNPGESPMDFCVRNGWEKEIFQMLVFDYLILNRDRHGANMEVLINRFQKSIRLAPLFDHGVSLLSRCPDEKSMLAEDVMEDKPVQCFVGSHSAWNNLRLIPKGQYPDLNPLQNTDKSTLLEGLDEALDPIWLDRIWEMIWRRWKAYENLRDQG